MFQIRSDAPSRMHSSETDVLRSLNDIEFEVEKTKIEDPNIFVFHMKNANASIANALRRIMISEVETVAVSAAGIEINTSIIQDEVLAHRIGLIPFLIDPEDCEENEKFNFDVSIKCEEGENEIVLSDCFTWMPLPGQEERFKNNPPRPIHDDIVLAKLLPGQQLYFRAQCSKGIGKDHAKWSPVATAWYTTMPQINVNPDTPREYRKQIQQACPRNVFDIEDTGELVVNKLRDCTMCRECIRQPEWEDHIKLYRKSDHFIFTIESVGMIPPKDIFKRAIRVLHRKAQNLLDEMDK